MEGKGGKKSKVTTNCKRKGQVRGEKCGDVAGHLMNQKMKGGSAVASGLDANYGGMKPEEKDSQP